MRARRAFALVLSLRRLSALRSPFGLAGLFTLLVVVATAAGAQSGTRMPESPAPARTLISGPVDRARLAKVPGAVHPELHLHTDLGPADDSLPMEHMQLLLRRSPERQAAFDALVKAQQQPGSPSYHQWLTPEQIGAQFGPAPADVDTIRTYLQGQGFRVNRVSKSGMIIDFSGTAGQVKQSFATEIHVLASASGERRYGAVKDAELPEALLPAVQGFVSLSNIPSHPLSRQASAPQYLNANMNQDVSPADFYAIYGAGVPIDSGYNGKGMTIALLERSDINPDDVTTFREMFDISPATAQLTVQHGSNSVSCSDPGVLTPSPASNDEGEAVLDTEWAGALAPQANLLFLSCASTNATTGEILASEAAVDDNLGDILSLSYGGSEIGQATFAAFISNVWEQASAQGQTVIVAAGDSGSDMADDGASIGTSGLNVNAYASTAYNLAAGGLDFQDSYNAAIDPGTAFGPAAFWSPQSGQGGLTVNGYVPETTWNGSCASSLWVRAAEGAGASATSMCNDSARNRATQGDNSLLIPAGGGGGESTISPRPDWQNGTVFGLPSIADAPNRVLPDISLFASVNVSGHALVQYQSDLSSNVIEAGGTSFVAPQLAGIFADLATKTGGRLGNVAPQLYALAAKTYGTTSFTGGSCNGSGASGIGETTGLPAASCVFHDVQTGNNAEPCAAGTPNCYSGQGQNYGLTSLSTTAPEPAYAAGQGWDYASGLGSINVNNLFNAWQTPSASSGLTLTVTPVAVSGPDQTPNFTATLTWSSGPAPTGTVEFEVTGAVPVNAACTGSSSPITCTAGPIGLTQFTDGQYTLDAYYAGDANYAGLTASAPLIIGPTSTFPTQGVGSSSSALVPVTIPSGSTVTGFEVFGEGIQNSEFSPSNGGTCQTGYFPNGASCTMAVTFAPRYAGVRKGAVVATGNTLVGQNPEPLDATSYMSGTGQAAQGLFSSPFSYPLFAWGSSVSPVYLNQETNAFAVDGSGNIYIAETDPLGQNDIQVYKVAGGTVTQIGPPGGQGFGSYNMTNQAITCVAVDAGGTVYFADQTDDRIVRIQPDGSWYEAKYFDYPTWGTLYPGNCGIDAQGNLLLASFDRGFLRVNLQTMATTRIVPQAKPLDNLSTDAAGNVYYISANSAGGTNAITEYSAAGNETTFTLPTLWQMTELRADPAGNLYVVGDPADTRTSPAPWGVYEIMAGTTGPLVPVVTGLSESGFVQIAPNGDIYYLGAASATMTRYVRSEGSLSFQPVPVGSASAQTDVTLTNNGNLPLDISGIVADAGILTSGSDTTCSETTALAPNATCTIGVQFQPALNGPFVGNVNITDNDPNFTTQQQIVVQGSTPTQTQTITFPALTTPVQVGDTATLAAASDSGLPVSYTVTGAATLSGNTLTYTGPGTVIVTATQAGNSTYEAAVPVSQTITVQSNLVATTTVINAVSSSTFGASVTLSATVTPASGTTVPTGSVTFQSGTTLLGVAQLNGSGVATLSTAALPVGSDAVVASYAGDSNFQASASSNFNIAVSTATPIVTVGASPGSSTYGASVALSATVAGVGNGVTAPTGTVTFHDGTTQLGASPLSNGAASLNISSLTAGNHSITASYAGDANYGAVTSAALPLTVARASVQVVFTPAGTSLTYGAPLSAQVTVTNAGGAQPGGTVTFYDGAAAAGTATLQNGSAGFSFTALGGGTHSLSASYGGDTNDNTGSSAAQVITVDPASTTTALRASAGSGAQVVLTATVAHTAGSASPTGTVTFYDGTSVLGTAQPSGSGVATFNTTSLAAGNHTLGATYSGDANYAASSANPVTFDVSTIATTTTVVSSTATANVGAQVSFTATVAHASGAAAPTGTVTFFDGATPLGTAQLGSGATAVLTTSSLAIGNHTVTATYSGDQNYGGSASAVGAAVSITAIATTTTLSGPATIVVGSTLNLTMNVTAAAGTPGGTVTLTDGANTLGTVTLQSGAGSFSISTLAIGTHSIVASYAGNGTFAGSQSAALAVVVTGLPDYSVTANPSSLTIKRGSSGATTLTFTPINGYTGTIQMSCGTALPEYVSCSFSPTSVTFTASSQSPANVTLTIDTEAVNGTQGLLDSPGGFAGALQFACMAPLLLLGLVRRRGKAMLFLLIVGLGLVAGAATGCGGSNTPPPGMTPAGSYSVPVTISDGSNSHPLNLTVIVQ